jgi:hypothetical protein
VRGGQATKIGVRSADKKWNSQANMTEMLELENGAWTDIVDAINWLFFVVVFPLLLVYFLMN